MAIWPGTTSDDEFVADFAAAEPPAGVARRRARFKFDGDGDGSTAEAGRFSPGRARVGAGGEERRRLPLSGGERSPEGPDGEAARLRRRPPRAGAGSGSA